jgi:maltooligosyltrehalose trehalohydrolase
MEHEHNAARLLRGSFDAQWTDDIHHALHVLLTGETQGYYEDFVDATALLARCLQDGFAYQGELSRHSGQPRGENSTDLPTTSFVAFIQNHDQIGNRAAGDRLTVTVNPKALRAARAFLLLSPFIPLMFMGEDWATQRPFPFFTDHNDDLAELVRTGRRREFSAFFGDAVNTIVPDPNDSATFATARLDLAEAQHPPFAAELALTRHLLALRRDHLMPRLADAHGTGSKVLAQGAVLGLWQLGDGSTLRIALNLGANPCPLEPSPLNLLYGTNAATADSVRQGTLPAHSVAVWLSALTEDTPLPAISFA